MVVNLWSDHRGNWRDAGFSNDAPPKISKPCNRVTVVGVTRAIQLRHERILEKMMITREKRLRQINTKIDSSIKRRQINGGQFVVRPPENLARSQIFKRYNAKKPETMPPCHRCRSPTLYPAELRPHIYENRRWDEIHRIKL